MRRVKGKKKKKAWAKWLALPILGGVLSALSRKGTEVVLPMLTRGK